MKRGSIPTLTQLGQQALGQYESYLRLVADVSPVTIRNYLSDLRLFAAWYEQTISQGQEISQPFVPSAISTPTMTLYRSYLQSALELKPASVNRHLVTLKCYFSWVVSTGAIHTNPATVVKLVSFVEFFPRHITDSEEGALVAAVTQIGSLRDKTLIVLMLHTGLRASEVCALKPEQIHLGKRSGTLHLYGKGNKYREVPLNGTARAVLAEYIKTLPADANCLFPSEKTGKALTERALGYLVKKYAQRALLSDISPHDLRHRFGYRMAKVVPLHRLAQIMGHDSLDTTMIYIRGTKGDLQQEVEKIAWE